MYFKDVNCAFVLPDNEWNTLRETRIQWIRKFLQHSHTSVYNRKMQKFFISIHTDKYVIQKRRDGSRNFVYSGY